MHRSFNILAEEYRPMVLAYLRSLGADAHLAEDLAQECFIAAYESIENFEEGKNFGSWLRGIARNKALMHWRAASVRPPLSMDSRSLEGIEEVFSSIDRKQEEGDWWADRREAVRSCLGKLSDTLRQAVERIYHIGESLDEAAVSLGSGRAAIAQRVSRARKLIRSCVEMKLNQSKP